MNDVSIFSTFLVVFRESLEASLIVGIILTVLSRLQEKRYFPHVILSSFAAIILSIGICWVTLTYFVQLKGDVKVWTEAAGSLLACVVLTYMVVWMDSQAKKIKPEIEMSFEKALSAKDLFFVMSMPFLAVFREGAETVLFLTAVANQSSGSVSIVGGLSGLAAGIIIVYAIFAGGKKIPLRPLFKVSGYLLIFMAAGMLAYGIHESHAIGLIPEIKKNIWNINHILNEKNGIGLFLKSIFGYNGNPSLMEVIAYCLYLVGIFWFLKTRKSAVQVAS